MNEAIKLAIEKGGYDYLNPNTRINCPNDECGESFNCHYVLDPLFWQALGKALGWGEMEDLFHTVSLLAWQANALRFLELKLTGGDEEKFWKELLA